MAGTASEWKRPPRKGAAHPQQQSHGDLSRHSPENRTVPGKRNYLLLCSLNTHTEPPCSR